MAKPIYYVFHTTKYGVGLQPIKAITAVQAKKKFKKRFKKSLKFLAVKGLPFKLTH